MPEQLPQVSLGRRGHPDFRKAFREQQIENEPGIAFIGFLFAHFTGANLRGVSNPKFVAQFRQQALEPANRTRRFDAHPHRSLQVPVERVRFPALVIQSPLHQLPGSLIHHGNLLITCVKIAAYNLHCSAPFFRALVVSATKSTRKEEPTTSSNQPCGVRWRLAYSFAFFLSSAHGWMM